MHIRLTLLVLFLLSGCGPTKPTGPTPRQIHVGGSIAAYPFSTASAERLMRDRPDLIAPLVRAGGSGDGIRRFCSGTGVRYPDIVIVTRRMTASELAQCRRNAITDVRSVTIGQTAFVLVSATPMPGLSRTDLYRALTGSAKRWSAINPVLPDAPILVHGPTPDPTVADGLFTSLLEPGCIASHGTDCGHIRVRTDGVYTGHGSSADLIAAALVAPGTIGLLPYAQAMAHPDTMVVLPLDGVLPTDASIARGRYPASAPLILLTKSDQVPLVPGLGLLLSYYAQGLLPNGSFKDHGLILSNHANDAAKTLDAISKDDARL